MIEIEWTAEPCRENPGVWDILEGPMRVGQATSEELARGIVRSHNLRVLSTEMYAEMGR